MEGPSRDPVVHLTRTTHDETASGPEVQENVSTSFFPRAPAQWTRDERGFRHVVRHGDSHSPEKLNAFGDGVDELALLFVVLVEQMVVDMFPLSPVHRPSSHRTNAAVLSVLSAALVGLLS